MKYLINGISAKVGGGKSVLNNFLNELLLDVEFLENRNITVVIPHEFDYGGFPNHLNIIKIPRFLSGGIFTFLLIILILPLFLKFKRFDVVFNLADIPIPTAKKQAMIFDWAFAIYTDQEIWERMSLTERMYKKFKLKVFDTTLNYVDVLMPQTEIAKARLESKYKLKNLLVIPNAVNLSVVGLESNIDVQKHDKFVFYYLTHYYPHKNIEALLDFADQFRDILTGCKIILTLDETNKNVQRLLTIIEIAELSDLVVNVGPIEFSNIASFYDTVDALIMPSLLESFSGSYVEAMSRGKCILTSDRDFAKSVCGEAALYFDPLNSRSIMMAVKKLLSSQTVRTKLVENGKKRLDNFSDWSQVYFLYKQKFLELERSFD